MVFSAAMVATDDLAKVGDATAAYSQRYAPAGFDFVQQTRLLELFGDFLRNVPHRRGGDPLLDYRHLGEVHAPNLRA